ncbi:MAG: glycine cleavage system aminomethyltransferase GcvT [Opitutales bacterium]
MSEPVLKRTRLYDFHVARGARMVPFAGWEMPVQYTGILEEHRAVRSAAGLFDVSHMGVVQVAGPEAAAFLDRVLTNRVANIPVGKAVYALLCQEDGGVIDDLIAYRINANEFLLVLNASNTAADRAWLNQHITAFDCALTEPEPALHLLALQGPRAVEALQATLDNGAVQELGRFEVRALTWRDARLFLARTGYTGEDGFELFAPDSHVVELVECLSAQPQVTLAGLGARDSLRLEAGFPLYGHEICNTLSPLQAGLGFAVKLKKSPAFIGQAALMAQKTSGADPQVHYFFLKDKRIARAGDAVFDRAEGGEPVGRVLSGTQSPVLNRPIGSAAIAARSVETSGLCVEIRNRRYPLFLARPPLHKLIIEG